MPAPRPWSRREQLEARLGTLRPPSVLEFLGMTAICAAAMGGTFVGAIPYCEGLAAEGYSFLVPRLPIDDAIPLVPVAVWVYYSYFPGLLFIALLTTADRRVMYEGVVGYCATALLSLAIFFLVPSQMDQPSLAGCATTSCELLRAMYEFDNGYNALPSLHVAEPVFIAFFFRRYWPAMAVPVGAFAVAIAVSVLLTKRHFLIDVPAGAALGYACDVLACRLTRHAIPWPFREAEASADPHRESSDHE